MKIIKVYTGAGNTATIEKHTGRPAFKGDRVKVDTITSATTGEILF